MNKIIDIKLKEYKKDKELITLLEDSKSLYNLTSLHDTNIDNVVSIKTLKCCAKMIYLYLISKGGSISYSSRIELTTVFGMSYLLIERGINELLDNKLVRFNKISKIIFII